jgi:hypothetical protein
MLSVLAHPELEIAEAAIGALALLPEDRARLYLDVIMTVLPEAIGRSSRPECKTTNTRVTSLASTTAEVVKKVDKRAAKRAGTRDCEPR